jgi:sodium/potassium/calcium exchanger 6
VFNVLGKLRHTLFPTLHRFREQSLLGQIACLFAAPAVSLLTLTLPVVVTPYQNSNQGREKLHNMDARLVDFEEEGIERVLIAEEEVEENLHEMSFNKWLMAAQCIFGSLFCVGVLFGIQSPLQCQKIVILPFTGYSTSEIWLPVVTLFSGFVLGVLVAVFADKGNHPSARIARCSMGFFVSIVWIMAIADEVVNVLQVPELLPLTRRPLIFP